MSFVLPCRGNPSTVGVYGACTDALLVMNMRRISLISHKPDSDLVSNVTGAATRHCCGQTLCRRPQEAASAAAAVMASAVGRAALGEAAAAAVGMATRAMSSSRSGHIGSCGAGCCCWQPRPLRLPSSCWSAQGEAAGCSLRSPCLALCCGKVSHCAGDETAHRLRSCC